MESLYDFEKSQDQAPPCVYELSPETLQEIKSYFADLDFWLSLAILAQSSEQYAQAVQNSSMLDFAATREVTNPDLSHQIRQRLLDPDYLQQQAEEAEISLSSMSMNIGRHVLQAELQNTYNRKVLNENNYNLLSGQSLFEEALLHKAVDMMPCLKNLKTLEYWSQQLAEEREELVELLRERLLDFDGGDSR